MVRAVATAGMVAIKDVMESKATTAEVVDWVATKIEAIINVIMKAIEADSSMPPTASGNL